MAGGGWTGVGGTAWESVGPVSVEPGSAGCVSVQLSSLEGPQFYRLSFTGLSSGFEQSPMVGVSFVPSPGAAALLVLAGITVHRRRR